jgi:hypothetical protein
MILDHLIKWDAEADAIAALPQFFTEDLDGGKHLRGDVAFWTRVFTVDGLDGDGNEIRSYLPYVYTWVCTGGPDADLMALPNCMIVADREKAQAGEQFILHMAIPPQEMLLYFVEPVILGSNYPFG